MNEAPNFILIDGSYFIFFRFYALINWFKLAKKEQTLNKENPPIKNIEFVNKFIKTFNKKIQEIPKKLKLDNPIILVGKDCPRQNIWRMKHLPTYKATREYSEFLGGPFFAKVYNENLFIKAGAKIVFEYPTLEADDCLAILTNDILTKYPSANIHIITSDMDYLQLAKSNVHIYDLKFRKLTERKSSFNNAEKDLFVKILTGDKSDNISSVFKKCGPKTACKYFDNKELFNKKLQETDGALEKYNLNRKLIDFNEIPKNLITEFKSAYNILHL